VTEADNSITAVTEEGKAIRAVTEADNATRAVTETGNAIREVTEADNTIIVSNRHRLS